MKMKNVNESTHGPICDIEWIKQKNPPEASGLRNGDLALVDLFAGCGGITLGAWEAARNNGLNLNIRLAVDISEEAIQVYKENFSLSNDRALNKDIGLIFSGNLGAMPNTQEKRIVSKVGRNLDFLVAGPPCQGHSDLNNTSRRDDPRNQLYLKVLRAAELLNPNHIIIENVPTVIHDKSNVVNFSMDYLKKIGYEVSTHRVDMFEELGLPQRRKRHILLASKQGEIDITKLFNKASINKYNISDYLSDIENEPDNNLGIFFTASRMTAVNKNRVNYLFENDIYDLPNNMRPPCHRNKHSYKSMYGRLRWDQPAQTITSGFGSIGQGRFIHPKKARTITPHEAVRLQGFPDFYSFNSVNKRTSLQEMIGNAVPPIVSATIINGILNMELE